MNPPKQAVTMPETNPHAEREDYTSPPSDTQPSTLNPQPFWLREAGMLALRMLIGLYVLNLGYGFEGSFTQLKDYHFVSNLFTGKSVDVTLRVTKPTNPHAEREDYTHNRFADSWLGALPTPFPRNYLLGIDITQRDFENYGRPSYLRGQWRDHGWWYYYIYACAIKVPLGLWLLGFFALFVRIANAHKKGRQSPTTEGELLQLHSGLNHTKNPTFSTSLTANSQQLTASCRDEFILLFPAIVIFTIVSSKTGMNEHMRYVLPAFPYVFIFISQSARVFKSPLPLGEGKGEGVLGEGQGEGVLGEDLSSCQLTTNDQQLTTFSRHQLDNANSTSAKCTTPARGLSSTQIWRRRMAFLPATLVATLGSWLVASSLWIYPHSLSYFNSSPLCQGFGQVLEYGAGQWLIRPTTNCGAAG
jgi:hypothetical protein